MIVDGRLADIKTSKGSDADAFGARVADTYTKQGAPFVFVNASTSGIDPAGMRDKMDEIIGDGDSLSIRILGGSHGSEHGRW